MLTIPFMSTALPHVLAVAALPHPMPAAAAHAYRTSVGVLP